jgi:predicted ATP-grasp superfamily ATP-dependent carboligase
VAVTHGRSAAAASRGAAGRVRLPDAGSPDFASAVREFLAAHPGAHVVAASDSVLVALGRPGAELVDKAVLPERAAAAGLRVPPTKEFGGSEELGDAAGSLEYPVVVKAVVKTRSTEVTRVLSSPAELRAALDGFDGAGVVQPFATGGMRAVCGVVHDGRLLAVAHQRYRRTWPADAGTASAAVTAEPDLDLEAGLPDLLAGHDGVFQVQLVGDQVIDVNPRVYGSLPLAVAAGVNLPAIACRAAEGLLPDDLSRGRPGVRYRWLEGDVRSVLHHVRAGSMSLGAGLGALAPHRGTAHSIESLRDPGPVAVRVMDVLDGRAR